MDVNTATARELQQIKGVGPVLARKLMSARPFLREEDLLAVSGVGPVKYVAILARIANFADDSPERTPKRTPETERPVRIDARRDRRATLASESLVKMDLNAASYTQLQQIRGVGPVLAERIVEARPFAAVEDLLAVRGIGLVKYAAISARAVVFMDQEPTRSARSYIHPETKSTARFRPKHELEGVRGPGATLASKLAL